MFPSYHGRSSPTNTNQPVLQPFLQAEELPFAEVLSEQEVQAAFAAEGVSFGKSDKAVFTPTLTLWAWLSQVIHAGELASCAAAVARVAVLLLTLGRQPCARDTAAYCRARAKLPEVVLRRLVLDVGHGLERRVPADWLWHARHVKVADGTTATMADTDANQAAYPQQKAQAPGVGFPILRLVVLFSLATACVCGMELAPYRGKLTGETTLLRQMLDLLDEGDILLGDRCYCSYFLLALALARGVDMVVRQHACRKSDFRRGRIIARREHVVAWQKPQRPAWMDHDTYAALPATLRVREIAVDIEVPGFRVKSIVVVTTLLDERQYPKEDVADLYRDRWNAELDLRSLKTSLGLDHLRTKTPEMVRRDIAIHLLAYNLLRKAAAQAALTQGKLPRQIGFAGTRQTVAASWQLLSNASRQELLWLARLQFTLIAQCRVGERPDRVEPRAVKRRPKPYRLLQEPRRQAREKLLRGRRPRS